jgi:hypothetical protein
MYVYHLIMRNIRRNAPTCPASISFFHTSFDKGHRIDKKSKRAYLLLDRDRQSGNGTWNGTKMFFSPGPGPKMTGPAHVYK